MHEEVPSRAVELFGTGLYCSESVLQAMAEARGIQSELIPRIATGLGAGMGRTGGMCGAVSGALLGIGLVGGRDAGDQSIEPCFALVQGLTKKFVAQHGSTCCSDLIGCDLGTEEGQRFYVEQHIGGRCRQFVEDAARIAEEVLHQEG